MYPSTSMTLPAETLAKYVSEVFIETGSFDGRTVQMALDVGFERVISVEIDPRYISITKERFKDNPRVAIFEGDSLDNLASMIAAAGDMQITFWLDAHIQTNVVGREIVPLMSELSIIHKVCKRVPAAILIDDRRLMGNGQAHPAWKKVQESSVRRKLLDIYPEYDLLYEDSHAEKQDIIVARLP